MGQKAAKACGISIDTKAPMTLFLLRNEAQKKKLCKKKMPSAPTRRGATARGERAFEKARQNNTMCVCF